MYIDVEPDQESFNRVIRALRREEDGSKLSRDLVANLKAVMEPAAAEARSNVMAIQSGGLPHAGEPLRSVVAAGVHTYVRTGKNPVVGLEAKKTGLPRNFANAPKRLNSRKGWRHPVFGTGRWVTQRGDPDWFDRPIDQRRDEYRRAVEKALQSVADRIGRGA